MTRAILFLTLLNLVGCASTERVTPPVVVLPEDGTAVDYVDFMPRLRALAWRATEAFYRDRWDELDEAATMLDRGVRILKASKNVPARVQPSLATRCDALSAACGQLKADAAAKAADRTSDRLQTIHVMIRELRSDS